MDHHYHRGSSDAPCEMFVTQVLGVLIIFLAWKLFFLKDVAATIEPMHNDVKGVAETLAAIMAKVRGRAGE